MTQHVCASQDMKTNLVRVPSDQRSGTVTLEKVFPLCVFRKTGFFQSVEMRWSNPLYPTSSTNFSSQQGSRCFAGSSQDPRAGNIIASHADDLRLLRFRLAYLPHERGGGKLGETLRASA